MDEINQKAEERRKNRKDSDLRWRVSAALCCVLSSDVIVVLHPMQDAEGATPEPSDDEDEEEAPDTEDNDDVEPSEAPAADAPRASLVEPKLEQTQQGTGS